VHFEGTHQAGARAFATNEIALAHTVHQETSFPWLGYCHELAVR
jgi:hypothetical protein